MPNTDLTPCHVLMTAHTIGGVWTYALELALALNAHGVSLTLATMGALPTPEQRDEAAGLPDVRLVESDFKLEWMQDPWRDVAEAGDWLLELERSVRPDLVHLNGYAHGALAWNAPKLVVGHSCVWSWWRAVHRCDPSAEWNKYRSAVAAGLHAADLVICPSDAMLRALQEH